MLLVHVVEYLHNQQALDRLGQLAAAGKLTQRVAEPIRRSAPPAKRRCAGGGVRGRILITF